MTGHFDDGLVVLRQHLADRIENTEKLRAQRRTVRVERDVPRHVQRDVVARSGHADTGPLQFGTKLGFLLIHVVPDGSARQGADTGTDQRVLTPFYGIVTRHQAGYGSGRRADKRALGRLARFRLPGIGVKRFTPAQDGGHARDHEQGFDCLAAHSEISLTPSDED